MDLIGNNSANVRLPTLRRSRCDTTAASNISAINLSLITIRSLNFDVDDDDDDDGLGLPLNDVVDGKPIELCLELE
ncbi:hypothetical protein DERP_005036 [Dermatophagoides pteronyssinus]|uniref:Uncharacterized protein n=1 Tax=Dermatophagoides pteronyssinus TaxID=6956 RepID=A0ABQ8JT73_DERPT|nr:hypothetical protein DERP_005036 [Dermatophagoides pteronyssinus]